ncbi:MAG TPA: PA2779 family protein [Porticoccaceae bacterium]|nr:PA2779 family protein [Porticoccaceae bacterium]
MIFGKISRMDKVARILTTLVLALSVAVTTSIQPASAAMMGTAAMTADARGAQLERVDSFLAQQQVLDILEARGVNPDDARARVAALSDAELAMVSEQIDELPAGAGALAVIGVVFLVLVILEIVGVINVFKGL